MFIAITFFATTAVLGVFIILFSFKRMRTSLLFKSNSNNKNDDDGGLPTENLPLIDIPPSCELEDMLIDRWYDDVPTSRKSN